MLWDGQQLDTSVAVDVPLTDTHGAIISAGDLGAALRSAVADLSDGEVEEAPRDAFGIPAVDA
ncbi:hypothetical protein D0Z67_27460 [Streptomyces seoulensis]|uniref:Uncharacterized protein n=1 Tax=Streptomyces seoulensis TaxID=73044 RepID=A0A4P6U135_STRSO|nr:hypothetical protein D0Z67_27460 [Streptomyces seoulensis]